MNTKTVRFALAASAVSLAAIAASPVWAANKIAVTEDGEGGGAMSLKLEPASVPAGPSEFDVTNQAASEKHEMVVVRLKSADAEIPFNKARNRIDEKKLKSLGEVSDLKPGASGSLSVDLKPGTYLVFCNIKGHYAAGMQAKLTVTK